MNKGLEIGIDLGTTNTVISFVNKKGKLESLKFGRKHTISSAVYFKTKNDYIIGENALKKGLINPTSIIKNFKSKLGDRSFKFSVTASESKETFEISAKNVTKIFLNKVIEKAQTKIQKKLKTQESIDRAVITVPAKFSPTEKEATKWAAEQNGIDIKVAFEPTAAAIAYQKEFDAKELILVYDFGGGTFDVSLLSNKNGSYKEINSGGDKTLGGNLINEKIFNFLKKNIMNDYIELPDDVDDFDEEEYGYSKEILEKNWTIVYEYANRIKEELSEDDLFEDNMTFTDKEGKPISKDLKFTRASFNKLIKDIIQKTIDITKKVVEESEYGKDDIKQIVLAGGSSKIPLVREKLKEYFGSHNIMSDGDPSTLISEGAAILANNELGGGIKTEYKIQNEIGIKTNNNSNYGIFDKLVSVGEILPFSITKEYRLTEDNQKYLNIEIYERDIRNYPNAIRVMDDGIEQIDTFTINNLPKKKVNDLKIIVNFKVKNDGSLGINVEFKDRSGNIIHSKNLEIKKYSILE
jgi:molecular chaperone DnaK